MTLHQLQYFAEIVRQRSFTRAARQLHISQPALSKSVRLLEQEFEAEFIETPRTLRSPTAGPCFTSTRKSCWLLQTPKPGRSDSAFKAPPTPCTSEFLPPPAPFTITPSSASFRRPTRILFCRSRRYHPGASSPFWMKDSWTWVWYWSPYPGKRM